MHGESNIDQVQLRHMASSMASFTKKVDPRLTKRPLVFNERAGNRELTSLVKEATGVNELNTSL